MQVTIVEAAPAADVDARSRHGRARRRRDPRARHRAAHRHGGRAASRPTTTDDVARGRDRRRHAARRHRRARHRRAPERRAGASTPASPIGPTGGIVTDRRAWQTSADGVWAAGDCVESFHRVTRQAGRDRARHAREQAGPRRRRSTRPAATRTFPGVDRHRGHEDLRLRGRAHRAHRARGEGEPASTSRPRRSKARRARRLLPGRGADHGQGRGRDGSPAGCSARRSSARKAQPSASTCWRPRSGTR